MLINSSLIVQCTLTEQLKVDYRAILTTMGTLLEIKTQRIANPSNLSKKQTAGGTNIIVCYTEVTWM